jgi:hypothetical protein
MRLGILTLTVIFTLAARNPTHSNSWGSFAKEKKKNSLDTPGLDETLVTGYQTPNDIPTNSVYRRSHRSIVNSVPTREPEGMEKTTKKRLTKYDTMSRDIRQGSNRFPI